MEKLFYEQKQVREGVVYLHNSIFAWAQSIHVNSPFLLVGQMESLDRNSNTGQYWEQMLLYNSNM